MYYEKNRDLISLKKRVKLLTIRLADKIIQSVPSVKVDPLIKIERATN